MRIEAMLSGRGVACSPNQRVNLSRSRTGGGFFCQPARRLRAARWAYIRGGVVKGVLSRISRVSAILVLVIGLIASLGACGGGAPQAANSPTASLSPVWQRSATAEMGRQAIVTVVEAAHYDGSDIRIVVVTHGDLGSKRNRLLSIMPRVPASEVKAVLAASPGAELVSRGVAWRLPDSGRSEHVVPFPAGDLELLVQKGFGYTVEVSIFRQR